jgi:Tol biopolymer transport system component
MSLSAGTRIGPYEIRDHLGTGGMGEVYRARDTRLDRDVAVKILPQSFAADPDRLMRFEREAKTLAALNHPHIAQVYGVEDSGGTRALVMELVEGEELAQRIARGLASPTPQGEGGAIPLDDALSIARQIADALEAAHEAGIIHRDLKPANIKVRSDGTVKVLDFGLAKPGSSGAQGGAGAVTSPAMTMQGVILGTAAYMAPEQARGSPVDARADLWAFGCVLFEMLAGTRPFAGETVTDVLASVVKEEPRWEALPAETPASVRRLLGRCLQKDRKRRLASAADARLEIEEALDPDRADSTAPARTTPLRSPVALALGLPLALAAVVGAYFLGRGATPPATPAPVTRFVIAAPAGTQISRTHRDVAVSPDGQQVAFLARGAPDQHVYVRRVDELAARQIAGTEGARDLAFSPDGRWLAFHAGNRISKVNLAGGAPTVLADAAHTHGLAWHPTEDAIYFAPHQASAIWKVPASGDAPSVAVTTLDAARGEAAHAWPVFSADGATLVFTVISDTAAPDQAAASFVTLATSTRHTARTGARAFALTDRRELLFVRRRVAMAAEYRDNQLSSSEVLDATASILEGDGAVVALSPTGTLAYSPSPDFNRRSLVWISPDGRQSDAGFGRRDFGDLSISPDGRRLAVTIGDDLDAGLYLADAGGGSPTLLTKPAPGAFSWSPDGKWIAAVVRLPGTGRLTLSRVAVEPGRTWEPLLETERSEVIVSQLTPDGRRLLVSRRDLVSGRRSVATVALDSARPAVSALVETPETRLVQLPSLSPDGRWLAYESNEQGRPEVYVQRYPSSTARVQVSRDGGSRPMWTPRGDALYFVAGSAIVSSAVRRDAELSFDAPRVIVNDPQLVQAGAGGKSFDVAPDGRILAIKEDESVRSDHIVVVQNWLSEVRSRRTAGRE